MKKLSTFLFVFSVLALLVSCNPERCNDPVDSIIIESSAKTIYMGFTDSLSAVIVPDTATNKNVTWVSSDESVATVDANGKLTPKKTGKVKISVITEDLNKTASCEVTVHIPVIFNTNGGSDVDIRGALYGGTVSKPSTDPTKTGYTFKGWTSESSATTESADYNFSTPMTDTVNLNAKWQANKYSVIFDKNDDDATGTTSDLNNAVYDEDQNIPSTFTKDNWTFVGWAKSPNGPVVYKAGETAKNISAVDGDTVTLYAKWVENGKYSITYNANNPNVTGSVPTSSNQYINKNTESPDAGSMEYVGHTLVAWNTKEDGSGTSYPVGENISFDTEQAVTLYAVWEYSKYTINYKDQGDGTFSGTQGTSSPTKHTYNSTTTLVNPTKTGYTFGGWFTNSACTGTAVTCIGATDYTADLTLYAKWTANKYTVKFDKNDTSATGSMSDLECTYDTAKALTANSYVKTGYVFDSWNTKSDGKGTSYADKANVSTLAASGSVTLYAQWKLGTKGTTDGHSWVQLWEGGPKWAEFNVGATISDYQGVSGYTTPDVVGGYYCWGGTKSCDLTDCIPVNNTNLSGSTDAATKNWGNNWRMPTLAEVLKLLNLSSTPNGYNYSYSVASNEEVVKLEWYDGNTKKYKNSSLVGLLITGTTEGYTDHSIFLPLAGAFDHQPFNPEIECVSSEGAIGYFRTSTPFVSYSASTDICLVNLGDGSYFLSVGAHSSITGYNVRAVVNE